MLTSSFQDESDIPASNGQIQNFYYSQLEEMAKFELTTMYIDFKNLEQFNPENGGTTLANAIREQYYRYVPLTRR
jgi:MCM N-terminal domain